MGGFDVVHCSGDVDLKVGHFVSSALDSLLLEVCCDGVHCLTDLWALVVVGSHNKVVLRFEQVEVAFEFLVCIKVHRGASRLECSPPHFWQRLCCAFRS